MGRFNNRVTAAHPPVLRFGEARLRVLDPIEHELHQFVGAIHLLTLGLVVLNIAQVMPLIPWGIRRLNYLPKAVGRNTNHSAARGGTSDLGSARRTFLALCPGDLSRIPMDPYEAPFVSLINTDGSWFCPGCHSLNRSGSPHCYSCRAAYPLAVPSARLGASRKISVGTLLISLVLLVASASVIFGRTNSSGRPAASTPLVIAVEVIETSSPSPDITVSILQSAPTAHPTSNAPTATPTPTPTLEPTAAPTSDRVPRPAFPVSVSGAVIAWFSVTGDSPASLIASLQAAKKGICDMTDLACFSGTYTYTYAPSTDPKSGVCTITSVNLTPAYTIILPRWSAPDLVLPCGSS